MFILISNSTAFLDDREFVVVVVKKNGDVVGYALKALKNDRELSSRR